MNHNPEEFNKQRKAAMLHIIVAIAIQVIVLAFYYFREKQTILAFPMILGIFISISGLIAVSQLGKR